MNSPMDVDLEEQHNLLVYY